MAKFRKPITYVTSSSNPEKLGTRRYSLRGISLHREMDSRRIPVGITIMDVCSLCYKGLSQALPMLIPADSCLQWPPASTPCGWRCCYEKTCLQGVQSLLCSNIWDQNTTSISPYGGSELPLLCVPPPGP